MIKGIFRKPKYAHIRGNLTKNVDKKPEVPKGMWVKCIDCRGSIYSQDIKKNGGICPKCGYHFPLVPSTRIKTIIDKGTWIEMYEELTSSNPLGYDEYDTKLNKAMTKTKQNEAVVTGTGNINGVKVALAVMDSRFMMGSMGSVVGEKITRLIEHATKNQLPLIIFSASGGARMQEGIFSLMQMAKTSSALAKHDEAGLLYISVLTNPTTGGVTASFAMLGDIIVSEPGALIGFAGPRVIEQTIKQKLPEGFQRPDFLQEHGMIDCIIQRKDLKEELYKMLYLHSKHSFISNEITKINTNNILESYAPWESVQIARHQDRPNGRYYIDKITKDFIELHGDRAFGDDTSIVGGIGIVCGIPVTIIAQNKGMNTKENIANNFGMPHPEGYRKALRLMKQAEKFQRPVICLVDTPGAYCGIAAEERGQAQAIAQNLFEMSRLKVPIISIIIGEGGSGGALALGVSDVILMQKYAIYSVLSPEGFASILWKDASRAKEAANVMKITSKDLYDFKIIDDIIDEPEEGAHTNPELAAKYLLDMICGYLQELTNTEIDKIIENRYDKFRKYGEFNN